MTSPPPPPPPPPSTNFSRTFRKIFLGQKKISCIGFAKNILASNWGLKKNSAQKNCPTPPSNFPAASWRQTQIRLQNMWQLVLVLHRVCIILNHRIKEAMIRKRYSLKMYQTKYFYCYLLILGNIKQ